MGNKAVDWWTFGILIYELMLGRPPFEGMEPMLRYKKTMQGLEGAKFPPARFSPLCTDLIKEVCHKDPSHRLPMRPGGVKRNLYPHKWYNYEHWELLETRGVEAPLLPVVKNERDLRNFASYEENTAPHIPYVDPGTGWDADF